MATIVGSYLQRHFHQRRRLLCASIAYNEGSRDPPATARRNTGRTAEITPTNVPMPAVTTGVVSTPNGASNHSNGEGAGNTAFFSKKTQQPRRTATGKPQKADNIFFKKNIAADANPTIALARQLAQNQTHHSGSDHDQHQPHVSASPRAGVDALGTVLHGPAEPHTPSRHTAIHPPRAGNNPKTRTHAGEQWPIGGHPAAEKLPLNPSRMERDDIDTIESDDGPALYLGADALGTSGKATHHTPPPRSGFRGTTSKPVAYTGHGTVSQRLCFMFM